ncbi:helix-turn-helix domain-containing protein [Embleya sp. NPDC055664]
MDAVEEVMATATALSEAESRGAALPVTLECVRRMVGALDVYVEAAVRDALVCGLGWQAVAAAAGTDPATARSTWGLSWARRPYPLGTPVSDRGASVAPRSMRYEEPSVESRLEGGLSSSARGAGAGLAVALVRLHVASGISLAAVAARVELPRVYVALVLAGEVRPPWAVVAALTEVYGRDPAVLFGPWRQARAWGAAPDVDKSRAASARERPRTSDAAPSGGARRFDSETPGGGGEVDP